MTIGRTRGPVYCSICAHPLRDPRCRHPWHLPFENWPKELLGKLRQMCPDDWEHRK